MTDLQTARSTNGLSDHATDAGIVTTVTVRHLGMNATSDASIVVILGDIDRRAFELAGAARAPNTRRAYRSDFADFTRWCVEHDLIALPTEPTTVGRYLVARESRLSMATIARRLSSIATAQRLSGHPLDTKHPAIREIMQGLRRTKGVASRHAEALTAPLARKVLETCAARLIDVRDRALILVGVAGAFRRSELTDLDVKDVKVSADGLKVYLRRSKGDQDGGGAVIGIMRTGSSTCPVAAYEAWINQAGINDGRVFRLSIATAIWVRRFPPMQWPKSCNEELPSLGSTAGCSLDTR